MMMIERFRPLLENKKVAILGFGREGKATYKLYRKLFPVKEVAIVDRRDSVRAVPEITKDEHIQFIIGDQILDHLNDFSMIIKTPGISLKNSVLKYDQRICSQTDLFLSVFKKQVIGITGTKGKSTTSSLIYHILKKNRENVILAGNIGISPFELIDQINDSTLIVYELSSHQLEFVHHSPHIAVLLNYFQEHLDHYESYDDYKKSKYNIARFQQSDDYFIFNIENEELKPYLKAIPPKSTLIPFAQKNLLNKVDFASELQSEVYVDPEFQKITENRFKTVLPGDHNQLNIIAAIHACKIAGIDYQLQLDAIQSFKPLEHRIEYIGTFDSKKFYNDSISTIPEASIAAVKALGSVDTLILGGFDRGIDYSILIDFVRQSAIRNLIFIGNAGNSILNLLKGKVDESKTKFFSPQNYDEAVKIAFQNTPEGGVVLLSPAASSYDMFKNFEERGEYFKKLVVNYRSEV